MSTANQALTAPFIAWIEKSYDIYAIPCRIKNEKRWESMDEIIPPRQPLEGIPQNLKLNDYYGVVLYSYALLDSSLKEAIVTQFRKTSEESL